MRFFPCEVYVEPNFPKMFLVIYSPSLLISKFLLMYHIVMLCNKIKNGFKKTFYFETFHHPAHGCLSRDCVQSSNLIIAETDTDTTTLLMLLSSKLYFFIEIQVCHP